MKLLFVTQEINEEHDDLAFVIHWVDAFIKKGYDVQVICLNKGKFDDHFPVISLGKELGYSKIRIAGNFLYHALRLKYDRVFVHMNSEYFTIAGWWWFIMRIPSYHWYTHYTIHIHLRIAAFVSKRLFAATKQSLPQYESSPKKIITGHGININFWSTDRSADEASSTNLLTVHRLSRSKRIEMTIETLLHLPEEFNLTIYGNPIDEEYFKELQELVKKHSLEDRVTFKGPVKMTELVDIYPKHRIMINMAMETIDKTMIEAMVGGVFPIVTPGNAKAIKLNLAPEEETSESIADFIINERWKEVPQENLKSIVEEHHGVDSLIQKFDIYMSNGN